jgi:lysophospholipase L1-like esterase
LTGIGVGFVAAVVLLEVLLRIPSCPMPRSLRTALFQCYSSEYADENIHFESAKLFINLPKPGVDHLCSWNGYVWHHHGDALGYRNPESPAQADVVLLGDSMTYGHGVEETSTAAHFLREELDRTVVNLGWTGDSPIQYLARLRNYALPLHPRVVIVFFFENDLDDILLDRTPDEIRKFVATGEAREATVHPRAELSVEYRPRSPFIGAAIGEHLLSLRALRFVATRRPGPDDAPSPEDFVVVPPLDEEVPLQRGEHLAIDYLDAATSMMARSARDAGTHIVFTTIPALDTGRLLQLLRQRVHVAARAAGVPFFDLVGKFAVDGRVQREFFLPYDGHLNEAGHRRVARAVAEFIRETKLLDAP